VSGSLLLQFAGRARSHKGPLPQGRVQQARSHWMAPPLPQRVGCGYDSGTKNSDGTPMSTNPGPFHMNDSYARLRPDASAEPITVDANFWQDLAAGSFGDFHNEYLVTTQSFSRNWPMWEMHPRGDEIVVLISGSLDIILEKKSGNRILPLRDAGSWVLVPRGLWHTARVNAMCVVLFITAGEGTQHRQVDF